MSSPKTEMLEAIRCCEACGAGFLRKDSGAVDKRIETQACLSRIRDNDGIPSQAKEKVVDADVHCYECKGNFGYTFREKLQRIISSYFPARR